MKNAFDGVNSRPYIAEERITEVEAIVIESPKNKCNEKKTD